MEERDPIAAPLGGLGGPGHVAAMLAWEARASAPERALVAANEALDGASTSLADRARATVAISAALLALHRPAEAKVAAREGLDLLAEAGLDASGDVACAGHGCMVRSAFLLDDLSLAIRHARIELTVAEASGDDRLLGRAHNDNATLHGAIGQFERALVHLQTCIQLIDCSDDAGRAGPLNNLGNVYLELGRDDEALACFTRARSAYLASDHPLGAAIARSNVGRALVSLRRFDEGVAALKEALVEFEAAGDVDYLPPTHAKLGLAYARSDDHEQAERAFELASEGHLSGLGKAFEPDTRRDYGRYLLERGAHAAALVQLDSALRLFGERASRLGKADTLRLMSRAHERMGDAPAALRDLQAFVEEEEALELERGELRTRSQIIDLEVSLARQHEVSRLTTQALAEANRALRSQAEKLEELSATDHLTSLYNRRYLAGRLADEVSRAERHGFDLSLVMVDVDSFKDVNDRFSHAIGDLVLRAIADLLRASFRRSDVVARWGGEEFAILLPSTLKHEAFRVAEKTRRAVAGYDWHAIVDGLHVTVSVGVVSLFEDANLDLDALLKQADLRLYLAKDGGRNRTVGGGG